MNKGMDKEIVKTYAKDGDASHHAGVLGCRQLVVNVAKESPVLGSPAGGLKDDALLWGHICEIISTVSKESG